MHAADDRLDLFLAYADEGRPVLEEGLPGDAAERAKKPKVAKDHVSEGDWYQADAHPNDLPKQKWAVIAPEGRVGDRQIEAIQALVRLREEEQGAPAQIYRVPPDMDARQSVEWKSDVYGPDDIPDEERPHYLLMLGDLHHTSIELQHALAGSTLVGRVHFADAEREGENDLDGYAAYADKVVRHARSAAREAAPDLLYYVADDGTSATAAGRVRLVAPSLAASRRLLEGGKLPAASVRAVEAETVDELLATGAGARPSVLLTVSHGIGAPRRGWASAEDQRRRQGAMVIRHDEILDAERLRGQPFLPGGIWFFLACFGAGTPPSGSSAYHAWLSDLADEGAYDGSLRAVLHSLPKPEWRPFLAAMPQAALANPEGPLAVIGHVDLAWAYGFSGTKRLSESRKSRIQEPLNVLVRGSRAGVALGKLMEPYRVTNDALMGMYQRRRDARADGRPDPTDPKERASLWMLRNDLRGYVLLGDPAVRLPLQQDALDATAPVTNTRASSATPDIASTEVGNRYADRSMRSAKQRSAPDEPLDFSSASATTGFSWEKVLGDDETPADAMKSLLKSVFRALKDRFEGRAAARSDSEAGAVSLTLRIAEPEGSTRVFEACVTLLVEDLGTGAEARLTSVPRIRVEAHRRKDGLSFLAPDTDEEVERLTSELLETLSDVSP